MASSRCLQGSLRTLSHISLPPETAIGADGELVLERFTGEISASGSEATDILLETAIRDIQASERPCQALTVPWLFQYTLGTSGQ